MGKIGYLVTCDGHTEFYSERLLPDYLTYDPDYIVQRVVYFEVEDD